MNELYAVEGKQSFLYNHFKDCKWDSCVATDTRLMGVIAMKITWKSGRSKIYQILHLDFSPIKGPEGNIEYLLHIQKNGRTKEAEEELTEMKKELIGQTVKKAHEALDV